MCSAGTSLFCLLSVYLWVPETYRPSGQRRGYLDFASALLGRSDVRRPFVLMSSLMALKQLAGTTVFLSYAVSTAPWQFPIYSHI